MSEEEVLYESLEKVIMEEKNLSELKKSIKEVSLGKLPPRELRKQIVAFRITLIDKMVKYVQFCERKAATNQPSEQLPVINDDTSLKKELQEKDKFLEEIGHKVNNIYVKLKNSVET